MAGLDVTARSQPPGQIDRAHKAANGEVVLDCQIKELFYGNFRAVRDTAVPIARNSITSFIGPSGCGKSTVLRCLNRMNELRQRFTIAIVTHNLQQAQRVADYTGFLYVDTTAGTRTGYLVEFGHTRQIFEAPQHRHTQQYIRGEFS